MPYANGNIAEVKIACWYNGQLGLTVRHYRTENVVGVAELGPAFSDQLATNLAPLYAALITNDAVFLGVSTRNISVLPAPASYPSSTGETPGTGGVKPLPSQVSGIITLRTDLAGRARRGRAYVPFPSEDVNDTDDTPVNAYMLNLAFLAVELRAVQSVALGADTADFRPVILSRFAIPPVNPIYAAITGTAPRKAWATQRRRGAYGASNPRTIPL